MTERQKLVHPVLILDAQRESNDGDELFNGKFGYCHTPDFDYKGVPCVMKLYEERGWNPVWIKMALPVYESLVVRKAP